jgi:hypothetical protein
LKKGDKENTPPRRGRKMIQALHELVDLLEYYMDSENRQFRDYVIKERAQPIEDYIHEISIDKNIDHIRFAQKLKASWKREQKEKENKNDE